MYVTSLLFGISASLDALLVGISYGIRGIRIRLRQNLFISLVALFGTCLSVGAGRRLAAFLPEPVGSRFGSLILILLGLYYIVKWLPTLLSVRHFRMPAEECGGRRPPGSPDGCRFPLTRTGHGKQTGSPAESAALSASAKRSPVSPPQSRPPDLTRSEVLTLSLTLSLNNLSAGLSAGPGGLPLIPAATATFVCSVLFLTSGNRLGGSPFLRLAGCAADPLSGLLLIALGLVQLFQ